VRQHLRNHVGSAIIATLRAFCDSFEVYPYNFFVNIPKTRGSKTTLQLSKQFLKKTEEQSTPTTLHTDQGSVYSSKAFLNAHKDYTLVRSMSRAGTPTDNPVIEAINGCIKDEIRTDLDSLFELSTFD